MNSKQKMKEIKKVHKWLDKHGWYGHDSIVDYLLCLESKSDNPLHRM